MKFLNLVVSISTILLLQACAAPSGSAVAKRVYFTSPADGAEVVSPFTVKFAVEGMDLKPAGDETPNSGHHHLLINMSAMTSGSEIPFSPTHLHFGKAQTEAEIKLPPGKYTMTLQFGNKDHLSYGAEMSKSMTVTVK